MLPPSRVKFTFLTRINNSHRKKKKERKEADSLTLFVSFCIVSRRIFVECRKIAMRFSRTREWKKRRGGGGEGEEQ